MICVMSAIKNMMPSKPDSEQNKQFHKQMQPIQTKDDDYKERYFAIQAERDALTAELEEYRNLAHLYEENQKKCDKVIKKSESFMRVVLSRYEEVKRFRSEDRERNVRWKREREILQNEIKDLLEKIKKRDNSIQLSISETRSLMEQLNNEKRDYQELIEQRRDASNKLEQLERELAWTKGELRDVSTNLESTKQERMEKIKELDDLQSRTINAIRTKTEEFNQYMDKVADFHSEINNIILRYNPLIMPSDPVRNNIPEQLEVMKESIYQLDELTANVLTRNITHEAMDALNRENEQLREQLEKLFGTTQTLRMSCRFNELRKQELVKNVNSYANKELVRQQQIHILHNRKIELTAENNDYQDQIKMLQKEIHILRAECDNARSDAEEVRSYLDPQSCVQQLYHENSLLKQKMDDISSQVAERSKLIQQLHKTIDQAKMTLQNNIHIIKSSNCLMVLLNELENRLPSNLECRDLIS